MTVFTIGHSTRTTGDLVALLQPVGVELIVDVRSYPRSRTNPQFDAERLSAALAPAGLAYRHLRRLGGRRGVQALGRPSPNKLWRQAGFRNYADYALGPDFRAGLDELLSLAAAQRCAVMCAEAVWWRCHRQIIADYLLARGLAVSHILGPGQVAPARLTPGAAPQSDGTVHYPPAQGSLF